MPDHVTPICKHEGAKVYENAILTSNPPGRRWICSACGEEGINFGEPQPPDEYGALKRRWSRTADA